MDSRELKQQSNISTIRVYFEYTIKSFQQNLAYSFDVFMGILTSLITIFVQVSIWRAIYFSRESVPEATLTQMITYVVISTFVGIITSSTVSSQMEKGLKSGNIGHELLRPVNFRLRLIAENTGEMFYGLITTGFPVLILGALFFGILPPASLTHFIFFIITLFNGIVIAILLELVIGITAFWFLSVWHIQWFLGAFKQFFSGQIVPLWFFPSYLAFAASLLPFKMIQYVPIALYLGKIPLSQIGNILAQQILWMLALSGLHFILWKHGIKRIVIHGG